MANRTDFIDSHGNINAIVTDKGIYGFFGDFRFLSNFYYTDINLDNLNFKSSEAAYMAQKTDNILEKEKLANIVSSFEAKKFGQIVTLKDNWDTIKATCMLKVLRAKFTQNKELGDKLVSTKDLYLEETNWWKDDYWGKYSSKGLNMLGILLMQVRTEIQS